MLDNIGVTSLRLGGLHILSIFFYTSKMGVSFFQSYMNKKVCQRWHTFIKKDQILVMFFTEWWTWWVKIDQLYAVIIIGDTAQAWHTLSHTTLLFWEWTMEKTQKSCSLLISHSCLLEAIYHLFMIIYRCKLNKIQQ